MTYVFPPPKIAFPSPAGGVQIVQWQVNSLDPRKRQFNQTGSIPPSLFYPSLIPSPSFPPSLTLFISLILFPFVSSYLTPFILPYPSQFSSLPFPPHPYLLNLSHPWPFHPSIISSLPLSILHLIFPSFHNLLCLSIPPSMIHVSPPPSFNPSFSPLLVHVFLHSLSLSFLPSLLSFTSPSFPNLPPSIHPFLLSSHPFYFKPKITVADDGLFKNTNQLKFCLVQDSKPSTEQVAHVKSKNKSPTSALGLTLLRHPEKKRKLFIPSLLFPSF